MPVADSPKRAVYFLQYLLSEQGFDAIALKGLEVVACEPGRLHCRMLVDKWHSNRYGTLHGGCTATLVDVVGSAALVTQSMRSGVSLAINTIYLKPMPCGEVVTVEANVIRLGRDVATVEVLLRHGDQLVAHGTHVKKLVASSDLGAFFKLADQQQQTPPEDHQQQQQQQQQSLQHSGGQQQPSESRKQQQQHSWRSKL